MKVFIDTEFNGFFGELLSLALVTENPVNEPSFYRLYPYSEQIVPWVEKHVVPYFHVTEESPYDVSIQSFLVDLCQRKNDYHVEIVADWPDDIRHFCAAIITGPGEMIDLPGIALTFTLERDKCEGPYKPLYPHNALSDASTNALNHNYHTRLSRDEEE